MQCTLVQRRPEGLQLPELPECPAAFLACLDFRIQWLGFWSDPQFGSVLHEAFEKGVESGIACFVPTAPLGQHGWLMAFLNRNLTDLTLTLLIAVLRLAALRLGCLL